MGQQTSTVSNDINKDLGFGQRVAQESRQRLLNQDGSFNVVRKGVPFYRSLSIYHSLLTMSWTKFYALAIGAYLVTNLVFAAGYVLCGPDALRGATATTPLERYAEAFFFSVQTLSTIGYGGLTPRGLAANALVTVEVFGGWIALALAAGLLFARFSRPTAKIVFSQRAVIAPYQGIGAFEFRIANERRNQLSNVEATVVLSRLENDGGRVRRKFHPLRLEREKVMFFPLHWVIVHPIEESSPLYGLTEQHLRASDAEFLVLLTALDETFSQTVHTRSSYKHDEVVWGAQFSDIFREEASPSGMLSIDLRALHDVQPVVEFSQG
jgi:inward rectifier potassium channel